MNLKQLKPKLNFIAKNMRPILTQIKVTKNALECTDLETYVKIKNDYGMSEGLQNYSTLGLVNSSNDITDYPMTSVDRDHRDVLNIDMSKLERCLQFASKDETRLYLNGVAVNNGHLVATDGHTMKAYELDTKFEHNYILPSNSLKVLIKLLKGYKLTGLVRLELNEQWATVETAQFTCSMRLIQREYPKWRNIVPTSFNHTIAIDNFDAIKEAAPLFKECKRSFASKMIGENGKVYLSPKNYPDQKFLIGACAVECDFEMGFNYSYLVRAANKKNQFTFKYNNELAPCEFNEAIVMPLKL
jgi:DNA polymerase III sliding clamp (beta) subunit (PCNA family)